MKCLCTRFNGDIMKVGRKFHFDSAHSIEGMKKCSRLHGHTYELEVVFEGEIGKSNMVIDFGKIKEIVNKNVIEKLDHQVLDDLVENPTAENITQWIWDRLESEIRGMDVEIVSVKLWEGKDKWVKKD